MENDPTDSKLFIDIIILSLLIILINQIFF